MMEDWANDDKNLLTWRAATADTAFEQAEITEKDISEQAFDQGILLVAMIRSGLNLLLKLCVKPVLKNQLIMNLSMKLH